jgi:hypothetical protein
VRQEAALKKAEEALIADDSDVLKSALEKLSFTLFFTTLFRPKCKPRQVSRPMIISCCASNER